MTALKISPKPNTPALRRDRWGSDWEIVPTSIKCLISLLLIALLIPVKATAFPLGRQQNDRDLILWDSEDEYNLAEIGSYVRDENASIPGFSLFNRRKDQIFTIAGPKIPGFTTGFKIPPNWNGTPKVGFNMSPKAV